jgi:NAD(P)-dependent dehydrogenase (short-subunit alcohol dehydrogenase family)
MSDLKGKNIIVTGASGGIGNSIIEKLISIIPISAG